MSLKKIRAVLSFWTAPSKSWTSEKSITSENIFNGYEYTVGGGYLWLTHIEYDYDYSVSGNKFVKCAYVSNPSNWNDAGIFYNNYEIYYTNSNAYKTDYYSQYNILYRNASAKDSVIIGSAAPVFVHTLVTNHSYDEVKNYTVAQWESHAKEVGTKVIDFDPYDRTKRYDIPENTIEPGQCYVIIAHYANDTALKSEVMVW